MPGGSRRCPTVTDTAGSEVEEAPVDHVVAMLRERLYGAISCLATLVVLTRYTEDDTSGWARMLDVAVTMGGLWAASLLADWVAHLAVHEQAPHGMERWRILQASGQIDTVIGIIYVVLLGWIAVGVVLFTVGVARRRGAAPFGDGGGIVVTVTHDMRLVGDVDEILVIDGGSISVTTPKDYFADRAPKIHVVSKSVEA